MRVLYGQTGEIERRLWSADIYVEAGSWGWSTNAAQFSWSGHGTHKTSQDAGAGSATKRPATAKPSMSRQSTDTTTDTSNVL